MSHPNGSTNQFMTFWSFWRSSSPQAHKSWTLTQSWWDSWRRKSRGITIGGCCKKHIPYLDSTLLSTTTDQSTDERNELILWILSYIQISKQQLPDAHCLLGLCTAMNYRWRSTDEKNELTFVEIYFLSNTSKQSCKKKHSTYNINSGSTVGEAAGRTSGKVNTIKGIVGFGESVDVVVVARVC